MKPQVTRTLGQLHFEDLDPHRFEDLVRQLVYSLRDWSALEALGRSGADDGVDIRGVEIARRADREPSDGEDDLDGEPRVWFIQCKREKAFGPAKARAAVLAALAGVTDMPHGFMLVAPADLSKRTREALRSELQAAGVHELVALGRAELEDMLFRPENDQLLFAYFGVSLQVRRRRLSTDLRARLTKKRQIYKAVR